MREIQVGSTAKNGQAYIHLTDVQVGSGSVETPDLLIAKIRVHGSKRDPTPKCASGFVCSDGFSNPFEYGHVMSWEMGGPNQKENIVPMYGRWQANVTASGSAGESWRDMEVEIKALAQGKPDTLIYLAVVQYTPTTTSYDSQSQRFKDWKQMFAWEEARIPTGFQVYVEKVTTDYGKLLVKHFLTPGGLGADAAKMRAALLSGAYGGTAAFQKSWDHSKLPAQDADFLLRNMTAVAVDQTLEAHELLKMQARLTNEAFLKGMAPAKGQKALTSQEVSAWAEMPMSPGREDDVYSFINDHPKEVQDTLMNDFHCDSATAKGVTPATMVRSSFHGNPLKREVNAITKARVKKKEARKAMVKKLKQDARFLEFVKTHPAWKELP